MDSSDGFELDPDSPGIREETVARRETIQKYQKRLQDYADLYEASLRTIKNWKEKGKSVGDWPPLDEPSEMAAWWDRLKEAGYFKWKVPEVLAAFSESPKRGAINKAGSAARVSPPDLDAGSSQELGFAPALQRIQQAELLAYTRWQAELARDEAEFDPVVEQRRAKAWEGAAEKLASLTAKSEKALGAEFAKWEDVERAVTDRELKLRESIKSVMRKLTTKFNLSDELMDNLENAYADELDKAFVAFNAEGGEMFELEA